MKILLPNIVSSIASIDSFNQQIYAAIEKKYKTIVIDASNLVFITPLGMISMILGIKNLNKYMDVYLDLNKCEIVSYLERLNFFEYIPKNIISNCCLEEYKSRNRNDTSSILLEILPLTDDDDLECMTDSILKIFSENNLSSKVVNNIVNITTELGTNIYHHSEGQGYVTVQLYKKSSKIRIGIADDGIGIINKFKVKATATDNQHEILRKAFMKNETTREDAGGLGLNTMRVNSFADSFKNSSVLLKTGNNIYNILCRDIQIYKTTSFYPGTYYDFCIEIA
ncbi:ATP-binding protein [Lysinibacillus sp. fls2-241-R2A-57]|uniref:ATP-binding protein n=1 Tax=Lysinibacillus sp. fls2-241-R2A-57 TaxID=3040292 RepID=UPI0025577A81|nr:ATP-binding protein [Lysinibacillus sp. fls2-241-R2A-57]